MTPAICFGILITYKYYLWSFPIGGAISVIWNPENFYLMEYSGNNKSYPPPLISVYKCLNERVQSILSKFLVIKNLIPYCPPKHLGHNFTLFRDKKLANYSLENIHSKFHHNSIKIKGMRVTLVNLEKANKAGPCYLFYYCLFEVAVKQ